MKQPKFVVFFLVGRGKFYCAFIKSQKEPTLNTVKLLASFCIFKSVSNCSRLEWEHSRFLLILIKDKDFNTRRDITVFACVTSSGFISSCFALTWMVLRNAIWSVFCLGCFDPCLNYFSLCPLKEWKHPLKINRKSILIRICSEACSVSAEFPEISAWLSGKAAFTFGMEYNCSLTFFQVWG